MCVIGVVVEQERKHGTIPWPRFLYPEAASINSDTQANKQSKNKQNQELNCFLIWDYKFQFENIFSNIEVFGVMIG